MNLKISFGSTCGILSEYVVVFKDVRFVLFTWTEDSIWEKVLSDITRLLYQYIQEGSASEYLQSLDGVAVGFADGDLNILVEKQ